MVPRGAVDAAYASAPSHIYGGHRWLNPTDATTDGQRESNADLLTELVAHLRKHRTRLRQEWDEALRRSPAARHHAGGDLFRATSVYDNYVEVLGTGWVEALQHYARNLSERIVPSGVEVEEVLGIVLLLRDVLARSLFEKYPDDFNRVLDVYEPAANRIANTVAINFVQERERVIGQQPERSASCRRRCCRSATVC